MGFDANLTRHVPCMSCPIHTSRCPNYGRTDRRPDFEANLIGSQRSASKPESHIAPVNEDAKGCERMGQHISACTPIQSLISSRLVYLRAEGVSFLVSLWRGQRWGL